MKEEQILQIKREKDTNWEDLQDSAVLNDQVSVCLIIDKFCVLQYFFLSQQRLFRCLLLI